MFFSFFCRTRYLLSEKNSPSRLVWRSWAVALLFGEVDAEIVLDTADNRVVDWRVVGVRYGLGFMRSVFHERVDSDLRSERRACYGFAYTDYPFLSEEHVGLYERFGFGVAVNVQYDAVWRVFHTAYDVLDRYGFQIDYFCGHMYFSFLFFVRTCLVRVGL